MAEMHFAAASFSLTLIPKDISMLKITSNVLQANLQPAHLHLSGRQKSDSRQFERPSALMNWGLGVAKANWKRLKSLTMHKASTNQPLAPTRTPETHDSSRPLCSIPYRGFCPHRIRNTTMQFTPVCLLQRSTALERMNNTDQGSFYPKGVMF